MLKPLIKNVMKKPPHEQVVMWPYTVDEET